MKVEIEKGLSVPPVPKRAGRPAFYPFATMQTGESFQVQAGAEIADPVKTLKSSVSVANKKFSPKRFEIRREGKAARIFRTA